MLEGENKTIISIVNGEGSHITLHRDHMVGDGVATMRVIGVNGEIVSLKLNRDNRYRLKNALDLVGY